MHYSLFIPNGKGCCDGELAKFGLGEFTRDGGATWRSLLGTGPEDMSGALGCWIDDVPQVTDDFTWIKIEKPAGAYWVGWPESTPPRPDELRYKDAFPGEMVRLGDGQEWEIAAARRLPHTHGMNPLTGQHSRRIAPQYAEIYDEAMVLISQLHVGIDQSEMLRNALPGLTEKVEIELSLEGGYELCSKWLGLNYRLNEDLISDDVLNLIDDRSMVAIAVSLAQIPDVQEVLAQKKTALPSPITVRIS